MGRCGNGTKRWKVYVESGVEEADLEEGSLIAKGDRERMVGLWEFISVIVVGGVPRSINFDPEERVEMETSSWSCLPLESSF